jgi:hypothetical protein
MLYNIVWEVVNLPPLVLIVGSFMICRKIAIKFIYPQLYPPDERTRYGWVDRRRQ